MPIKTCGRHNDVIALSFLGATLITVFVCFILSFVPNELDTEMILNSFVPSIDNFVAETSEKLQFVFGTVTFVFSFFIIGKFTSGSKIKSALNSNNTISVLLILFMGLCIHLLSKQPFFTNNLPLKVRNWFISGVVLILVAYILIKSFPLKSCFKKLFKDKAKLLNFIWAILGLASIAVVSFFFLRETYFYGMSNVEHHTDAYFYPIWKVWSGQYPLVDFASLYGYYPYFFIVPMLLLGGVSIRNFSVVITLLVATVFITLFYTLYSVCKRKIYSLLALLSIEYILVMYNTELSADFYLQYLPHRMITLCLILAICCAYIKHKRKASSFTKIIEILGWICSGAALLWNLDTGIVVWLGWAIYLCFIYLLENSLFCKNSWLFILKTVIKAIITALVSFFILFLLTRVLSGEWVTLKTLFWGQSVFYGSGFFMIKMKLWHPWLIVILTYAIALAVSLSLTKDLRKTEDFDYVKTAILFMMSVVGVGSFLYYQGRSHDFVFVVIVWPAVSLASLFLDGSPVSNKENETVFLKASKVGWKACLLSLLLMFSFGWYLNITSPDFLVSLKSKEPIGVSGVEMEVAVVNQSGISPENLDLLTSFAAETYEHFGIRYMPKTQAEVDIFSYEDIDKINDYLNATEKDVIIGSKTREYLVLNNAEKFSSVLEDRFVTEEINGYLVCRLK